MNAQEIATTKLLRWLKLNSPEFFNTLPVNITDPAKNGGLGGWEDVLNTIANAAIQYDNNKTARKQIDINIARAQAGQDPVSFNSAGQVIQTTTNGVSVSAKASNTFLYIALAIGAGALFMWSQKSGNSRARR
jgi:hypothetical protein